MDGLFLPSGSRSLPSLPWMGQRNAPPLYQSELYKGANIKLLFGAKKKKTYIHLSQTPSISSHIGGVFLWGSQGKQSKEGRGIGRDCLPIKRQGAKEASKDCPRFPRACR